MSGRPPFCSPSFKPRQTGWLSPAFYAPFPDDHGREAVVLSASMPLRERSYAESMSSEEAAMIQKWLNEEDEKNFIDSKSPASTPKTEIFQVGSPSHNMTRASPALFANPFGDSGAFFEAPPLPSGAAFSALATPPPAETSPASTISPSSYSPLKYDPFFKSFLADNVSPIVHEKAPPSPPSPSSLSDKENQPRKSSLADFSVYDESTKNPIMGTGNITVKRSILADISKQSEVEFVPNSWLTLYHSRPHRDDPQDVQAAWMERVWEHLRPPEDGVVVQETPGVLSSVMWTRSRQWTPVSPLSMPSALQSGRHQGGGGTGFHTRSILKPNIGSNRRGTSGSQAVRFRQPLTTIKRPAKIQSDTPTTWPQNQPQSYPCVPTGRKTKAFFGNIWEGQPGAAAVTSKGWIPYQTPEHVSSGSSSSSSSRAASSNSGNVSTGSKTTVMISGKENTFNESSVKSIPSRLKAKKLHYEDRQLNEIL